MHVAAMQKDHLIPAMPTLIHKLYLLIFIQIPVYGVSSVVPIVVLYILSVFPVPQLTL